MALKDELAVVLGTPGQHTPESIYDALDGQMKRIARNPDYIEFTLNGNPQLFVCEEECWSLKKPDAPPPEPLSTSSPPTRVPRDPNDPRAIERELRDALAGCRLVCETTVNVDRYTQLMPVIEDLLRHVGSVDQIAERYPATFVTFLVCHGIYGYEGGAYWSSMRVEGIDHFAGRPFEEALRYLDLETFSELIENEEAWRYVAPILAHGGIPKYCLDDYFSLILKDLVKIDDASELLSLWRSRRSTFVGMGKPVRRFVLYGGDVAVDFIDRTVELFREHARTGVIPHPDTTGLPRHVCTRFKNFITGKDLSRIGRRRGAHHRVTISFDPWQPTGPTLELPASSAAGNEGAWLISGEGKVERIPTSSQVERTLVLSPARAWSVELTDSFRTISETAFEGVGDLQALFFDPVTGHMVRTAGGINLSDAWILYPETATISSIDLAGETKPIQVTQELPYPSGDWSHYKAIHADLEGVRGLLVDPGRGGEPRRVAVRPPGARPSLRGAAASRVTTAGGNDVYAEVPRVWLPDSGPADTTRWRVRLIIDGESRDLEVADLVETDDGLALPIDDGCHRVDLTVRGPLGADLRTSFAIVPGLDVIVPDKLLFPNDRAVLYAQAPGIRIDGSAPGEVVEPKLEPDHPGASITVEDEAGRSIDLQISIDRLLWTIDRGTTERAALGTAPATISSQDLFEPDPPRLLVHIGQADHALRLELTGDNETLQTSETVKQVGRGGRWVFDLSRFADTIRNSDASRHIFMLWVGHIPVRVANVRLSLEVENLIALGQIAGGITCVEATFDALKPRKHRVARLWSLTRPWEEPIVENIPADAVSRVEIYGDGSIPVGKYLLEITMDDGWSEPRRPRPSAPGTTRVSVGTAGEIRNRSRSESDPLDELEAALANGRYARHLNHDELIIAAPAATETMLLMLRGDVLHEHGSLQYQAICSLALADEPLFAESVREAYFSDQFDPVEFLRLTVTTVNGLSGRSALSSTLARSLWEITPALMMAMDIGPGADHDASDRIDEMTGWQVDSNPDGIARGEPVTQQYLGLSIEQLDSLRPAIDLVPRQHLDIDTLVDANFQWLRARLADPDLIESWWTKYRKLSEACAERFPRARAHLEARVPPNGTEAIAALPLVILTAALETISDTKNASLATKALIDAVSFAPKLVRHDLVLALALLHHRVDATEAESEIEAP